MTWSTFIKIADDTEQGGVVDMFLGKAAGQRDLICRNERAGVLEIQQQ